MILLALPVELLLDVGSHLSPKDLASLATTSKNIRRVFMIRMFGGTVHIRSPFPSFFGVRSLFNFLQQGMPGLPKCTDQVEFYRQHDLARHVHTVRITNWAPPSPQSFCSRLAEGGPEYQALLAIVKGDQYYFRALRSFCSIYDFIVVNLVRLMPLSELELVRSHITPHMHFTLTMMPTLRRLTLKDCTIVGLNFPTNAGTGGQYESFKFTSEATSYLPCTCSFTKAIQVYLSLSYSTLTKLEISIEFLRDDALDHLSLPSLTYLAIVPRTKCNREMWSWGTVYRILRISPNITCFRFEPLIEREVVLPFAETSNWKEYKRNIGKLPLSQLSSITAYRQLVKRLVPGRPVSFVKILLFRESENLYANRPDAESDDEANQARHNQYIVPPQLVRSTTPVKTLYLQRINEQEELKHAIWADDMDLLHNACPSATDLWLPSLKITSRKRHYRDPVDAEEILEELRIWHKLERCAIGPCSPWLAKELEWFKEGSIIPRRVHLTLEELLLEEDALWKWQDDSDVTGWVLYVSADIEGSEDSEEAIYPPDSRFADPVSSDSEGGMELNDSETDSVW